MPSSDVAIGRRMNGSETLMAARSMLRVQFQSDPFRHHGCALRRRRMCCAARCGSVWPFWSLLAASSIFGLRAVAVAAATLRTAPLTFARRKIRRRRLIAAADAHLRAVGQIGETGGDDAVASVEVPWR